MKKKFKFNKDDVFIERVVALSKHYNLSSEITEHILQLSKDSYVSGSNSNNEMIQSLLQFKEGKVLNDDEIGELIDHIEEEGYLDGRIK